MNFSSGGLRVRGTWGRSVAPALLGLALAGAACPLPAAPRGGKPAEASKPAPAPAAAADIFFASPNGDDVRAPAPDLLLKKENTAKADALAAFSAGLIAEDNADSDKALEEYQKSLALDPANTELAVKVAYDLARRGSVTAGIEILKDTIQAAPGEPAPYLYLSQLYAKYLKKPDTALKYAQKALELDPSKFAFHLAVYELLGATGQPKKAAAVLANAAKQEVNDPDYYVQVGEFYSQLYLQDDGTATPENLKKMESVYQKALSLAGDNPEILAKVADFYASSRQVKQAIPLYLKVIALKQQADTSGASDPSLAAIRDKLAESFRLNNQRDDAIATLKQLIQEDPLRYESYELLAELYAEKGDQQGALASYQQMLLLNPAQPANYVRVADALLKMQKFDEAIRTLTDARAKFPRLPILTYYLALAQSQAKKPQEAVVTFEEALHEGENAQPDMIDGRFYFTYGMAAEQAGLIEKAVELMKKSIELDPATAAEACNYIGYMWTERGEHLDEAGEMIKRAVELDPENPAYLDSLGWWFYKKNEPQKAIEQLEKAVANLKAGELKSDDAVIYEHVGDAYTKLNNVAQALVYWQQATALDPANKEIAEKLENAKQKLARQPATAPSPSRP